MKVRLCFGREMPAGPIGPRRSETGALVEGRRSRGAVVFDMMGLSLGALSEFFEEFLASKVEKEGEKGRGEEEKRKGMELRSRWASRV